MNEYTQKIISEEIKRFKLGMRIDRIFCSIPSSNAYPEMVEFAYKYCKLLIKRVDIERKDNLYRKIERLMDFHRNRFLKETMK